MLKEILMEAVQSSGLEINELEPHEASQTYANRGIFRHSSFRCHEQAAKFENQLTGYKYRKVDCHYDDEINAASSFDNNQVRVKVKINQQILVLSGHKS